MASGRQEDAAVLQNALAFLGPLQQVAEVAKRAGDLERYLKDAQPRYDEVKGRLEAAQSRLDGLLAAIQEENSRLETLYKVGVLDAKRRVQEAEVTMAEGLVDLQRKHDAEAKRLGAVRDQLEREVVDLQSRVGELRGTVDALNGEAEALNKELDRIALRARRG